MDNTDYGRCYHSRFTGAGGFIHSGMVFAGYIFEYDYWVHNATAADRRHCINQYYNHPISECLKPSQALAGFGNSSIWLIVAAFLFAKSFIKTGLGRRIAFWLITKMGTSTLKLAYTIILSDLIISPATPSNAARAGGILFPIVRGLASAFDSEPNKNPRRVGRLFDTS